MKMWKMMLVCPLVVLLVNLGLGSCRSLVDIEGLGKVEGTTSKTTWTERNVYEFYNIPYAQSPSVTGRFKHPEKALPWDGVYNATTPRRICPQLMILEEIIRNNAEEDLEDCLTLNVFTPKLPKNKRKRASSGDLLPVMFYIHGGGFYEGNNRDFIPSYLLEKDIVLVVPQYRITFFGSLCLHIDEAPGNAMFMDQLLALEWVNQHINSFGGDANQVTIFGQSAGAASVSLMLISPVVKSNLFQRAIVQSGSALSNWVIQSEPIKYATSLYKELAKSNETASPSEMLAALENATVKDLLLSYHSMQDFDSKFSINRGVIQKSGDKKFLTQYPTDYIAQGNFKTKEMIGGVVKDEGTFFSSLIYDSLAERNLHNDSLYLKNNLTQYIISHSGIIDYSGIVVDIFREKFFKPIYDKGENITFAEIAPGSSDILSAAFLKAPTFQLARSNALYNKTYFYTFDYKGENTRFGYGQNTSKYPFEGGVHHSDDLLYLFPYPYTKSLNENDTQMAKFMVDLWTSFAVNGTPTSSLLDTTWKPLNKRENGPYMHIKSHSYMDDDFIAHEYDNEIREYYKNIEE